ncbi:MAG TPA: VOC family protein [Gaiella sp.]|nr:VOC family protein [Gaiella sp.]
MAASRTSVGAITLFVEDAREAQAFYERVFGVTPVFEDDVSAAFSFDNMLVNLLARSAARELVEPIQVGDGAAGSRFQLTIWVDDADAECARLAELGVELVNGPVDRAWGVRTTCFADPDGHVWEVAQPLTGGGG